MIIIRYWLSILFILSIITITSVLIAEHVFKLFPCKMCLKQRHTYYVIIAIGIVSYL